jgi:hypothetical protein
MKRIVGGVSVALLMFVVGLTASWLYPTFTMTGSIPCDSSYCIYWFQSTMSYDYQEITLYNKYTSAEKSQYLFESNLSNGEIIERNDVLNEQGQKIGERGIVQSFAPKGKGEVRICWTDGSEVWFIAAPSLRLALIFEKSDSFQTALKINKLTKPLTK